jgi:hypothetical protein
MKTPPELSLHVPKPQFGTKRTNLQNHFEPKVLLKLPILKEQ